MKAIRIGVISESLDWEEWWACCVENMLQMQNVSLELLIVRKHAEERLSAIAGNGKLESLLPKLIIRWFLTPRSKRTRSVRKLSNSALIKQYTLNADKKITLTDADLEEIEKLNLDFIIFFSDDKLSGAVLRLPRLGVWRYYIEEELGANLKRSGLPRTYPNKKTITSYLVDQSGGDDEKRLLKQGTFRIINYSYKSSVDHVLFQTALFASFLCNEINATAGHKTHGQIWDFHEPEKAPPMSAWAMAGFLLRMLSNFFKKALDSLFRYEKWNIGVVNEPVKKFLDNEFVPRIHWMPELRDRFFADPFGLKNDGTVHILCEDYHYDTGTGVISHMVVNEKGEFSEPTEVLNMFPYHLAYPCFVDTGNQDAYFIPETAQMGKVGLYKLNKDFSGCKKTKTLLESVACVDTTVFERNGLWWMMSADEDRGVNIYLNIWYADKLEGPWKAHCQNPVKIDICSARPAGAPFVVDGQLYRPSQDSSETYGGRIVIQKVVKLTTEEFIETYKTCVEPPENSPFPTALHTLSTVGGVTLVDGKKMVFNLNSFKRKVAEIYHKSFRR